jgi:hypothetical protein
MAHLQNHWLGSNGHPGITDAAGKAVSSAGKQTGLGIEVHWIMDRVLRLATVLPLALLILPYLADLPTSFGQGKAGTAYAKDGGGGDGGGGGGSGSGGGGGSHDGGQGSQGGRGDSGSGRGGDGGGRGDRGGDRGADVGGGGASGLGGSRGHGGRTDAGMAVEGPGREKESRAREVEAEDRDMGMIAGTSAPR